MYQCRLLPSHGASVSAWLTSTWIVLRTLIGCDRCPTRRDKGQSCRHVVVAVGSLTSVVARGATRQHGTNPASIPSWSIPHRECSVVPPNMPDWSSSGRNRGGCRFAATHVHLPTSIFRSTTAIGPRQSTRRSEWWSTAAGLKCGRFLRMQWSARRSDVGSRGSSR